jgi:flagellar biogenesis protein FliO
VPLGVLEHSTETERKGWAMRLNILALLLIAYFIWLVYEMDREQKESRRKLKELKAEWDLRRAMRRTR